MTTRHPTRREDLDPSAIEYHMRRARQLRAEAMRAGVRAAGRALRRLLAGPGHRPGQGARHPA